MKKLLVGLLLSTSFLFGQIEGVFTDFFKYSTVYAGFNLVSPMHQDDRYKLSMINPETGEEDWYSGEISVQKEERDLKKAQKAPMIAMAIANTAVGVTKALEQAGPVGIALGVLVAAAGALEVATIQAQEFASGGIVQGNPSLGDVVPVKATAGELILNQAQQENLAGGMGGITLNISAPLVDENILDVIIPAIEKAQQMDLA